MERVGETSLRPERELFTPENSWRWFVYSAAQTGLRLVCLEDLQTGVIVTTSLANPEKRVAAHKAWAGARHSRAPGQPWEIMYEMGERGVDPDQKLEEMFRTYGHASVGDMARLQLDLTRVPMHLAMALFNNTSINSGQEKSTRYQQRFGKAILHHLNHYLHLPDNFPEDGRASFEQEYQKFGELSLALFAKHQELLTPAFQEYYRPSTPVEQNSLQARVLDCTRFCLLFGLYTGQSLETSARDWSRMIGELKASPLPFYRRVALQIERFLTPTLEEEERLGFRAEAPSLIRHTEVASTINNNLAVLRQFIQEESRLLEQVPVMTDFRGKTVQKVELLLSGYTEGEKMIAQYLLTLWPGLDRRTLLDWIKGQIPEAKRRISQIIFSGHNNYQELPTPLAATRGSTLVFEAFLGEVRDLNRHRAWGRFIPLPLVFGLPINKNTAEQILAHGFGLPLYLSEIPEFDQLRQGFEGDLKNYYQLLYRFLNEVGEMYGDEIDYSFVINLLPLAHRVDIWMHGDPKQFSYMTHQRTRPGGHINYRALTFGANQLLADSDPYLEGLRLSQRPNPASREEFFNRS